MASRLWDLLRAFLLPASLLLALDSQRLRILRFYTAYPRSLVVPHKGGAGEFLYLRPLGKELFILREQEEAGGDRLTKKTKLSTRLRSGLNVALGGGKEERGGGGVLG